MVNIRNSERWLGEILAVKLKELRQPDMNVELGWWRGHQPGSSWLWQYLVPTRIHLFARFEGQACRTYSIGTPHVFIFVSFESARFLALILQHSIHHCEFFMAMLVVWSSIPLVVHLRQHGQHSPGRSQLRQSSDAAARGFPWSRG
jgi:hypothetical protein